MRLRRPRRPLRQPVTQPGQAPCSCPRRLRPAVTYSCSRPLRRMSIRAFRCSGSGHRQAAELARRRGPTGSTFRRRRLGPVSGLVTLARRARRLPHPVICCLLAILFEIPLLAIFVAIDSAGLDPSRLTIPAGGCQAAVAQARTISSPNAAEAAAASPRGHGPARRPERQAPSGHAAPPIRPARCRRRRGHAVPEKAR